MLTDRTLAKVNTNIGWTGLAALFHEAHMRVIVENIGLGSVSETKNRMPVEFGSGSLAWSGLDKKLVSHYCVDSGYNYTRWQHL